MYERINRLIGRRVGFDGWINVTLEVSTEMCYSSTPFCIKTPDQQILIWLGINSIEAAYRGESSTFQFVDENEKMIANF